MLHRIVLASLDSTNKYVEEHIEELHPPTLVFAAQQKRGKGQGTNRWDSQLGDVTFTLFSGLGAIQVTSFFLISQIVSLEIVNLLEEFGVVARIKWPNDILVGLEKISGILIRTQVEGSVFKSATIGIGLNIEKRFESPKHYNPPATAVKNLVPDFSLSPMQVSDLLAERILCAIEGYTVDKSQSIRAAYWERMFRNQGMHPFLLRGVRVEARITAVCDNGELHLQDISGKEYHCSFKDVSFLF